MNDANAPLGGTITSNVEVSSNHAFMEQRSLIERAIMVAQWHPSNLRLGSEGFTLNCQRVYESLLTKGQLLILFLLTAGLQRMPLIGWNKVSPRPASESLATRR